MKKRMLSFCLAFMLIISALPMTVSAVDEVKIDATNFPDPVFRSYVSTNFDLNGDLLLSSREANKVTVINLTGTKVADLEGINYFPNLTHLFLNGCTKLTSLYLRVRVQNLFLSVSGCTALTELNCSNCKIGTLDVSGCVSLKRLLCESNQLTSLDVSECIALEYFACDSNPLTNLDVSKCTALQRLWCRKNHLTDLNVSNCGNLIWLYCRENKLTHLDVSDCVALTNLDCALNELTHLDVSKCTALDFLAYSSNHITAMDLDREVPTHFPGIQTASLETKYTINGWTADLSKLVETEKLNKITLKEGQDWQYDIATGIASYTGEGIPTELYYIYHGNNVPLNKMLVEVTLFAKKYVVMKQGAEKAYVNGIIAPTTQYASGYAKMENISGTMQLPLRYIAEVNSFTVNYDENTGKTRVTNPEDGTYLLITPNSTTVTKHTADGTQIGSSDTPLAFSIKNGVTMGPLRFTCEALGMSVSYQETSHGIYVVVSQEAQTDAYVNEKIAMAYWLGL